MKKIVDLRQAYDTFQQVMNFPGAINMVTNTLRYHCGKCGTWKDCVSVNNYMAHSVECAQGERVAMEARDDGVFSPIPSSEGSIQFPAPPLSPASNPQPSTTYSPRSPSYYPVSPEPAYSPHSPQYTPPPLPYSGTPQYRPESPTSSLDDDMPALVADTDSGLGESGVPSIPSIGEHVRDYPGPPH